MRTEHKEDVSAPVVPGPCFLDLSPELIEAIVRSLDSLADLKNFRLICRYVNHATKHFYIRESFRVVFTDLGETSLHHLDMASKDPNLASKIKKIIIQTRYHSARRGSPFGSALLWPRDGPITPSSGEKQWSNVIQRLVNCTQLTITAREYYVVPSVRYRFNRPFWRDQEGDEDEVDEEVTGGDAALSLERTIEVVFRLIASAQMPLKDLTMWLCTRDQQPAHDEEINWSLVDTSMLGATGCRAALAKLQSFTFGRRIDEDELIPLLEGARNLQQLKLSLDDGSHTLAFIDRLSAAELDCSLQSIWIESAALASGESLRALVAHHREKLKRVVLCGIRLDEGAWNGVLQDLLLTCKCLEHIGLARNMQEGYEKYLHFDGIRRRKNLPERHWYYRRRKWRGGRPAAVE